MNKPKQKKNGNENVLTDQQEAMRRQIVDLELKARYWTAMYTIRNMTILAEKLKNDYNDVVAKQVEENNKAIAELTKQIQENNEKGITLSEHSVEGDPTEQLDKATENA